MKKTLLAVAFLATTAPAALAGPIELACLRSDRAAANRSLCGCIQNVADRVLTGREQRLAAKFFKDPHLSQEVRQSDRASDEAFWLRYKAFGATAEANCATG